MNAINLYEQYKLLSLWRLTEDGRWELVDFERPANANYRCRHQYEKTLFAFLPDCCLANMYQGNPAPFVFQKPRQAASPRHSRR